MEFPHFDDEDLFELRLFIEEIVCNICRFMHVARDGLAPESVRIRQEVQVGPPHAFADIVVEVPGLIRFINDGGMVYQFLGDSVIGFFGLPDHSTNYIDRAFDCARSLLMLGESVSNEWQRRLDRMQSVHGSHTGIALGDVQTYSLRPFSRTYIGAVGDAINIAARLSAHAQPGQIVVSNLIHRHLSFAVQRMFQESESVQAKNVGLIRAWTFDQAAEAVERHM
jgi:Adenylate and Guanylate cyclase catalytic domain